MVSHDRYFLERVTDSIWSITDEGRMVMLPNGVDQYLEQRRHRTTAAPPARTPDAPPAAGAASQREARKTMTRVERQLQRLDARERDLHTEMAAAAADHERLTGLMTQLHEVTEQKEALEQEWLEAAEELS